MAGGGTGTDEGRETSWSPSRAVLHTADKPVWPNALLREICPRVVYYSSASQFASANPKGLAQTPNHRLTWLPIVTIQIDYRDLVTRAGHFEDIHLPDQCGARDVRPVRGLHTKTPILFDKGPLE